MKYDAKNIVIGALSILLVVAVVFGVIGKAGSNRYKDTIRDLQEQNRRTTELLESSQGTVDVIAESITVATQRVGEISTGISDAVSAIDASIRITGELLGFVDSIGTAIEEYEKGISP